MTYACLSSLDGKADKGIIGLNFALGSTHYALIPVVPIPGALSLLREVS
jgi:hypothetical protein